MRLVVAALVGFTLAVSGPAAGHAATLLADPGEPGPNLPPAGRSLFDELFEVGPPAASRPDARYALPYPFERLLAELNARIAPAEATTVLIPLGRSLQRYAAAPDYFASPRIVAVVTDDAGSPDRPLLKDRLYLGYHERAAVIEIISYNEAAGRFEFQVVENYGPGLAPRVGYGERFICVACHQAHGPIFPTAVWNETNADPDVAARLAALGASFHGAPTRGGVDRADAFDRSTDRAAKLALANALWARGCGEPEEPGAARCRGELLLAALRYRLGGARGAWVPDTPSSAALADRLADGLARITPEGLGAPSPDLPNRDPLAEIEAGVHADVAVDPDGVFEPTLRRAPILYWRPSDPAADLLAAAVGDVAASFADADIVWLDERLAMLSADATELLRERVRCRTQAVDRGAGRQELRLTCGGGSGQTRAAAGYVTLAGDVPAGGLIGPLALDGREPVSRLVVAGGSSRRDAGVDTMELRLREAGLGLAARLASGERLTPLVLRIGEDGEATIDLGVVDDLEPLRAAIARMVEAARPHGGALGGGPLRRRAVLAELRAALDSR